MKKRVFSGFRPTGRQHIGNYLGAVQNFIVLQDEYDCVYCVVDIHALTTLENTESLREDIYEMVLDWLAAGIDPQKSIIFVQSHVPQVEELHTLFSMLTPLSWLLRVPTFKEKVKMQPHNVNYGLVGYPVLMTADIALYKGEVVPVGEDQLPHLELTNDIAAKFNSLYGNTFAEIKPLLTKIPKLLGIDGRKMSKSYGNFIALGDPEDAIKEKCSQMFTDPERIRLSDEGHPDKCNVYAYYDLLKKDCASGVYDYCAKARVGCTECKKNLSSIVSDYLADIRKKREKLLKDKAGLKEHIIKIKKKPKHTFVIHGEAGQSLAFAADLRNTMKLSARVPEFRQIYPLKNSAG